MLSSSRQCGVSDIVFFMKKSALRASRWLVICIIAGLIFPATGWSDKGDLTKALKQSKKLQSQGKYEEAVPFADQALSIAKGLFGRKDAKVAILLDNLAVLYGLQNEYSVAENYYEQALAIREEALGSQHPDVAASFNRLAVFYHNQKQYFAAEFIYKRALRIYVAACLTSAPMEQTSWIS